MDLMGIQTFINQILLNYLLHLKHLNNIKILKLSLMFLEQVDP